MPKGKQEPKPSPPDKRKERDEIVESAAMAFRTTMMEIATEFGLSSAEVFAIVSETLASLATTAMDAEHEEYFGPRQDEEETADE